MRLKSYFSGTVEAAMELAHQELGEDALLINARPSTLETRNLGAYEVVFGVPPKPEQRATHQNRRGFESDSRSALTAQAISQLQSGGVHPAVWMLEGFERPDGADEVLAAGRAFLHVRQLRVLRRCGCGVIAVVGRVAVFLARSHRSLPCALRQV